MSYYRMAASLFIARDEAHRKNMIFHYFYRRNGALAIDISISTMK